MLHKLEKEKKIQGMRFGRRGPVITHLLYADDTILFFKADLDNCNAVRHLLDEYAYMAGQVMNKEKSYVILSPNTARQFKRFMATALSAQTANKLGKYLGVQIDEKLNGVEAFKQMTDKIEAKLSGWKAKLLSQFASDQVSLGSRFWWPLRDDVSQPDQQMVRSCINVNSATWKEDTLTQFFYADTIRNIIRSPISLCGKPDSMIWEFSASGEYNVSEGFQLLSMNNRQNSSADFFP
ncbi:reverse transcriptase [Senna tora]|uniref:Reverse transcriptase n=1 Tax=Senna tora TaxID=362788 RepID=A0A834TKP6_9FABA|nr:reverse transcriptase [Senna tora]